MKESLLHLAQYHIWANHRMITLLHELSDAQIDADINSSFNSIRKTVYHSWSAEDIWLQRLKLVENPIWQQAQFQGNFEEALHEWEKCGADLLQFIENQYNDRALEHVVQYSSLDKQVHKTATYIILQHVFNHATYHRGQLVTMLRQVGITKIPSFDLIVYSRLKK